MTSPPVSSSSSSSSAAAAAAPVVLAAPPASPSSSSRVAALAGRSFLAYNQPLTTPVKGGPTSEAGSGGSEDGYSAIIPSSQLELLSSKHKQLTAFRVRIGSMDPPGCSRITCINGLDTQVSRLLSVGGFISGTLGGAYVDCVYNPTVNLADAATSTTTLSAATELVHAWRSLFREMDNKGFPGGTIIHYAHSHGCIVTREALSQLSPTEKRRLRIFLIGSPVAFNDPAVGGITAIEASKDPITSLQPLLSPGGKAPQSVSILSAASTSARASHGILGPDYKKLVIAIGERISLEWYCRENGISLTSQSK